MKYGYNLAGQLKKLTNPFGSQVGYTHDSAGQVTEVTGAGRMSVAKYAEFIQYRASGQLKRMNYGNGRPLTISYDERLRAVKWDVTQVLAWDYSYRYFGAYVGCPRFINQHEIQSLVVDFERR